MCNVDNAHYVYTFSVHNAHAVHTFMFVCILSFLFNHMICVMTIFVVVKLYSFREGEASKINC